MSRSRVSLGADVLAALVNESAREDLAGHGADQAEALASGEMSHLPEPLTTLLNVARSAPPPEGYGSEYALIAPHFNHAYYFGMHPDIARARLDPVAHYIRAGAAAGWDPAPFFSGAAYLTNVPEARGSDLSPFAHWLTHCADPSLAQRSATETDFNRLAPLFDETPEALLAHLTARDADLRARLTGGKLGEVVQRAAEFDPLISDMWHEALAPRLLPFANDQVLGRILGLHDLQEAAEWRRARCVLVLGRRGMDMGPDAGPDAGLGSVSGDGREARCAAMALALKDLMPAEEIVVLRLAPGAFAPAIWQDLRAAGVRLIEMPAAVSKIPDVQRARTQIEFLRSLRPEVCLVEATGPGAGPVWDLLGAFGRQLSAMTELVAWLPDGPDGPADAALAAMFYRSFQRFAAFWVPSQRLADDLRERFCLSDSEAQRLGVVPAACLPHAVPLSAQDIEPSAEARPIQVLGYAPGLDAPETDVFMALLGQQNAEACQGTLVFDHLGKQRRYGYFPKHVEICGAGEPAVGAALDSADLWLMCGQDLDAPMSAAQSGVPFVAPRDICQALGLDLKLCWCPPETAQGLPGLATAFASALAASPEERRRRAEALREQLAAQAPLEVMSRAVGARLSELTQGEQPKDIPVPDPAAAPMPSEDQQGGQKAASHQDLSPEALLTVAITAHSESHVAAPMLRSVARAIEMLQVARPDAQIELMVGFDSPTSTCRAFFDRTLPEVFPDARCLAFDFRDQGKTRNALARAARGRFFAVVDADDLVSENWLSGAVALLEEREAQGIDTIAHPEVNWQFDAVQRVYSNPDQSDPLFSPHAMAIANYYDAMCVAPTRLWRALPYADRDLAQGFALEDYQWFVEATALGWRHANVPDTVIFKRRRDASQHRDSRREGALIRAIAPLAIDALRDSLKREKPGAEASAAQKSDGFARSQQDRKRPSPLARLGALFKQQK